MNAGRFERNRLLIESRRGRSKEWRKRAMQHLIEDAGAEVISKGKRVLSYKLDSGQTVCFHRRFKTESDALDTLRQIAADPEPRTKPIRAYPCYQCNGWHVTSKAL